MRALALVALAACFNPTLNDDVRCGANSFCPAPQVCKPDGKCHLPDQMAAIDAPPDINVAFVTSRTDFRLDALSGLGDADQQCANAASAAQLPGEFRAWLSIPGTSAADRVGMTPGWIRIDREPFALSKSDLLAGKILSPLRIDETGHDVGDMTVIATATDADGNFAGLNDCFGNPMSTAMIQSGIADGAIHAWTAVGTTTCQDAVRLYCFEIDRTVPPPPPANEGRRIFLSTATTLGNVGRAAMNGICASEASAAGYPGTFDALIAMTGQSALDPLTLGADWVRPDGVVALKGANKQFVAPINVTTTGMYVDALAWGGALNISAPAALDGSDNCFDWTNGATNARAGATARSSATEAFGGASYANCGNTVARYHLYCVQQ